MTEIRFVDFQSSQDIIRDIRHRVFTLEQHVDHAIDFDGRDAGAVQVIAYEAGSPAGTGRMLQDGHIGRIAVLADYRGRGTGTAIMKALIARANEAGFPKVYLGAQVSAVPFYEKLAFIRSGKDYWEAGILHTPMTLVFDA